MLNLTFFYPPQNPLPLKVQSSLSTHDLKLELFSTLPIESGVEMRLVCGGKVLQDELSLEAQGTYNMHETLHILFMDSVYCVLYILYNV